jgi:hypothetical protein
MCLLRPRIRASIEQRGRILSNAWQAFAPLDVSFTTGRLTESRSS